MKITDIIQELEKLAPLQYAEGFDNVGLLVGDANAEVKGGLITLDTLEAVVDEAIAKKCNLIVSFHPIIFSGLKSLTGKNYVERVVMKAIQHQIAIYSMHTALDNQFLGVNASICNRLELQNRRIHSSTSYHSKTHHLCTKIRCRKPSQGSFCSRCRQYRQLC